MIIKEAPENQEQLGFVRYWYLQYLLATALYMLEPWERNIFRILFVEAIMTSLIKRGCQTQTQSCQSLHQYEYDYDIDYHYEYSMSIT